MILTTGCQAFCCTIKQCILNQRDCEENCNTTGGVYDTRVIPLCGVTSYTVEEVDCVEYITDVVFNNDPLTGGCINNSMHRACNDKDNTELTYEVTKDVDANDAITRTYTLNVTFNNILPSRFDAFEDWLCKGDIIVWVRECGTNRWFTDGWCGGITITGYTSTWGIQATDPQTQVLTISGNSVCRPYYLNIGGVGTTDQTTCTFVDDNTADCNECGSDFVDVNCDTGTP